MSDKSLKKIKIGWDIGGAHIKYCVESDISNIIWYDVINFEFWKNFKDLRNVIKKINNSHKINKTKIENYFTMSAEMCDCFDNRDAGVNYIIKEISSSNCESYIFTRRGFLKSNEICKKDYKEIASYNWYASGLYILQSFQNAIAIDFGSTTCDFLIIKNGKIKNKRTSDISGLQTRELLYTGCARTPLYAHMHEVTCNNKKYKIIPEQFSTMSDIYIILDKLRARDIYSKAIDGTSNSRLRAYKRVSRSFGFDYAISKHNLLNKLSKQIYNKQIDIVEDCILYHKNKYFKDVPDLKIIGLGLGHNTISDITIKNKLKYMSITKMLKSQINSASSLVKIFPSFVMCRLSP